MKNRRKKKKNHSDEKDVKGIEVKRYEKKKNKIYQHSSQMDLC